MGATHNDHTTQSSHNRKYAAQSGQAIVLIALAMVGLLGMAGIAIDGGMILFTDRQAQKVADIAAMSAAIAMCNGDDPNEAAINVANANGITDDDPEENDDGRDDVIVTIAPEGLGNQYLSVVVKMPRPPMFIQVVYKDALVAEGRSTTRCTVDSSGGMSPSGDSVLFATSQDCPYTLYSSGNNVTYDGNIRSNAELWLSITDNSSSEAGWVNGNVYYVTRADGNRREIWAASPPRYAGWGGLSINGRGIPVTNDPNDDSDAFLFRDPVQPAPLLYRIDDFNRDAPDNPIWDATPANRRTWLPGGSYSWPGFGGANELPAPGGVVQGLYFIDGDFVVTNDSRPMDGTLGDGVTIVATGKIRFNSGPLILEPYYSNLTMMSGYGTSDYQSYELGESITTGGTCSGQFPSENGSAIYLPTQQGGVVFGTEERPGLLYAPWGTVRFGTGNVGHSYGQVIAYGINSQHNSSWIHYRPGVGSGGDGPSPVAVYFVN